MKLHYTYSDSKYCYKVIEFTTDKYLATFYENDEICISRNWNRTAWIAALLNSK